MRAHSALLDEVSSWFADVRPNGTGLMVRCPAHDDQKQSLHVSVGDDGRILFHCHAGCETEVILSAVGKSYKDLFERRERVSPAKPQRIVATYDYVNEGGELLYQAVRLDPKGFKQRQPNGQGWTWNLQGVRRVLYHLDEIQARPKAELWIVEGEKDVDRLRSEFGVLATCNAMGAEKWTDELSALIAGRKVVIVPDNDDPGRSHAERVAASCAKHGCRVRVLVLPGIPVKGDVSDWLDLGGNADQLKALRDACLWWEPTDPNCSYIHMFALSSFSLPEFPVDVFPPAISRYIEYGAAALNVPPDLIAMPLLGFAAGVIGNRCAVGLKSGWIERPNIWVAVIGDPGSGKSPAIDYARVGIDALQKRAWDAYINAQKAFEEQEKLGRRQKEVINILLDKPNLEHYFTTDATTQALSKMLSHSPGLTIFRDELVGWVKSHDAYNKAGDRQNFLSLWSGAPLKVDRSSSDALFVTHPCIPIVGGIQPDMLPDLAEEANRRDGFIERMLMVWPDTFPQQWTDADIHPETTREVIEIFSYLRVRAESPGSGIIQITAEARAIFAKWFNENGAIMQSSDGIAKGCYSKYPGQLGRIALILHCLRNPGNRVKPIEASIFSDAIAVIEYLRAHLVRILPKFQAIGSSESASLELRVVRVLGNHEGEWVARRDLHRGLGNSVSAAYLNDVLVKLAIEGLVENQSVASGARPREESRIKKRQERTYEHMNILEQEDEL